MEKSEKRGVFFSGDALVAVAILLFVLILALPIKTETRYETEEHQDLLDSLSVLKIGEVNNSYVRSLIANGEITKLNNSVLEQIGIFYVTDVDKARTLTAEVLRDVNLSGNVGIWFGSTLIYNRNQTAFEDATDVDTARQILSGITNEEGGSVTGFSARAFLSSNTIREYYYFGGYVGDGNISIDIPDKGNVTDADMKLVINRDFKMYVNGIYEGNYSGSPDEFTPVSYALPIGNFADGGNVEFIGDNLHIAGGRIRVTYQPEVQFGLNERYLFPGVAGLINIFDGFYVPGELNELEIFLDADSSTASLLLNVGNVTILNRSTDGRESITINDATLSSLLDYDELSEKTVPVRLGLTNISYSESLQDVETFSVTDLSGSMDPVCRGNFGVRFCCIFSGGCNNEQQCNTCGGVFEDPIGTAKQANDIFIDVILNYSGNRVGLVGYADDATAGYHALSNDSDSLHAEVDSWIAAGRTCICCGINRAVSDFVDDSIPGNLKSMMVMSDGYANEECAEQGVTGDLNGNGAPDDAGDDAIQAACDAYNEWNITIHTIGFGLNVDGNTLQEIASCAGGNYYSSTIDELVEIYQEIADEIIAEYIGQTLNVQGNFSTRLYSGYIDFEYTAPAIPNGLILFLESGFDDDYTGTFSIPGEAGVVETRVTSYSGPRWTSGVRINGDSVYNLSEYGDNFVSLGDPFIVNIPNSYVLPGSSNLVNLTTGEDSSGSYGGSIENTIISTIVKNVSAFSDILPFAEGCVWSIQFEDDSMIETPVPSGYSGGDVCTYTESEQEVENDQDAYQIAVLNLLRELDLNPDNGKIDFIFSEENLDISLDELSGIPFVVSSEVQARRWY